MDSKLSPKITHSPRSMFSRSLAMICCLILVVSCLPLTAWAAADVTGEGSFKDADAKSVVAAIFIALGVSPGEDATDFNTLVDECVAAVAPGGTVSMYVIPYSDTQVQSLVSAEFVDTVRSWVFENGVVSVSSASSGKAYYNGIQLPDYTAVSAVSSYLESMPSAYLMRANSNGKYYLRILNGAFFYTDHGENYFSSTGSGPMYILGDGVAHDWRFYSATSSSVTWGYLEKDLSDTAMLGSNPSDYTLIWSNFDVINKDDGSVYMAGTPLEYSSVSSIHDLYLGDIAASGVSMAEGYSAWCGVPYTVDGATYYALQINDSYDLTIQQNQSGSQSGLSNAFIPSTITGLFIDVSADLLDGPVDTYIPGDVDRDNFWFDITITGTGQFDDSFNAEISDPELTDLGATAGGSFLTKELEEGRSVRLTVGAFETAASLTVKFTSVQDPSISVSYTLTNAAPSDDSGDSGSDNVYQEVLDNIQSSISDLGDKIQSSFSGLGDQIQDLFSGGESGSDLTDTSGEFSDTAGEIDEFEQSQMDVLDENMEELKKKVDFVDFVPALAFVQKYINLAFDGAKDFSVIFYLPLFLGLFFYICSRVPGVTRFSRPSAPVKKEG